jgi:hypothetical protein
MKWYTRWKEKRSLRKSAKMVKLCIDNLPSEAFRNMIKNADGTFMEPAEAMTRLYQLADMWDGK